MLHWMNKHLEAILLFVSVVLVALLVAYYVVVIRSVGARLEAALNASAPTTNQAKFDVGTASQLNLKGLSTPAPTP